jgi:hypothetical protein
MSSPIDSGVRHEAVRGLHVIWLAFLGSIFFYVLILLLLGQQSDAVEDGTLGVLRPAFWILATILSIASFVWRLQVADLRRPLRASSSRGFTRLRVACLVTWSFCEAIALLGVVLGAVTYRFADYAPLVSLGVILLFVHRPAAWPIDRFLLEDFRR